MDKSNNIKEIESIYMSDKSQTSIIVDIMKSMESNSKAETLAALHSLRRIYVDAIESKRLLTNKANVGKSDEATWIKLLEYKKWMTSNILQYLRKLVTIIENSDDIKLQTAAIRTFIEFVKREHMFYGDKVSANKKYFGLTIFQMLMNALIHAKVLDIDVLLMIRSEIFSYVDTTFYGLHIVNTLLHNMKNENEMLSAQMTSNILDILRIMSIPDEDTLTNVIENKEHLLVIPSKVEHMDDNDEDDEEEEYADDNDNDDDVSSDGEDYDRAIQDDDTDDIPNTNNNNNNNNKGNSKQSMKRQRDQELLQQLSNTSKSKKLKTTTTTITTTLSKEMKKKKNQLPLHQKIYEIKYHKNLYMKCWLIFLNCKEITLSQHKVILKHFPQYILPYVSQPLLFADYLTSCYTYGGIVAVLTLETLFQLITQYHLDYPDFFVSLYHLCTLEVFSAKYRTKFMSLLSASLKSTNLPVYLIASFIKRLSYLSMAVPAPSSMYCIALITWLLREHPECHVLLHHENTDNTPIMTFDNDNTIKDLQFTHAMSSSLWELEMLKLHYSPVVSEMVNNLENPLSTVKPTSLSAMKHATSAGEDIKIIQPINMSEYESESYQNMMEVELKKSQKRQVPLSIICPKTLFGNKSIDSDIASSLNNTNKSAYTDEPKKYTTKAVSLLSYFGSS